MIGTPFIPQAGDSILVLAGGGIVVANPNFQPFIFSPTGEIGPLGQAKPRIRVKAGRRVIRNIVINKRPEFGWKPIPHDWMT